MRRDTSIPKMVDPNLENYIKSIVEEFDEYPGKSGRPGIGNSVPQFEVHLENEFINFMADSVVGVSDPIRGA